MSEEYFYDRSRNIQGVSDIDITKYFPSYGLSADFKSNVYTLDLDNGYYKKYPNGLNSLSCNFKLSIDDDHDIVQRIANKIEYQNSISNFVKPKKYILTNNKIYKKIKGVAKNFSIEHFSKNRSRINIDFSIEEAPNFFSWRSSNFLNFTPEKWEKGISYKKNDVVYFENPLSEFQDFKIDNFFYCIKDHDSSELDQPYFGRSQNEFWARDFYWSCDQELTTNVDFKYEQFEGAFPIYRKEKNHADLGFDYIFSSIGDRQALAMLHFLENKGGYRRFTHKIQSIYNRSKVFICESWQHQWNYNNNHTIKVSFVEDKVGIMPKEYKDNQYIQSSFSQKEFCPDILSKEVKYGAWWNQNSFASLGLTGRLWSGEYFVSRQSTEFDYDPFIEPPVFGEVDSSIAEPIYGTFGVDTITYIGASIEETISTDIPDYWKDNISLGNNSIDRLEIGTSCTDIGVYSFRNSNITGKLEIPRSVTRIRTGAFEGADKISGDLFIPKEVGEIEQKAFYQCQGFKKGDIFISETGAGAGNTTIGSQAFADWNYFDGNLFMGDGVKEIGFRSFQRLAVSASPKTGRLVIGNCVTGIGREAFDLCGLSGELNIPNSVLEIGRECFDGNQSYFEKLTLGGALNKIGYAAFRNLTRVKGSLTIPPSVEFIDDFAFLGSTFDEELNINTNALKYIGTGSFRDLDVKSGELIFGARCEYIGNSAFEGMTSWNGPISLPTNNDYTVVKNASFWRLYSCTSNLKIPENIRIIEQNAFGSFGFNLRNYGGAGLLTFESGVEYLGQGAFADSAFIGDLIMPDTITEMDVDVFLTCRNFDGGIKLSEGLKFIPFRSFLGCNNITGELLIHEGVTGIDTSAFGNMYKVDSLYLPDSLEYIGQQAFDKGYNMSNDLFIPDKVKTIGLYTFYECGFKSVRFPTNLQSIGGGAFYNMPNVQGSIDLPNTLTTIGGDAFRDSTFNGSLNLGTGLTSVGDAAFRGTDIQGSVYIPNSLTVLRQELFQDTNIDYIDLNNVSTIERDCFLGCYRLNGDPDLPIRLNRLTIPSSLSTLGTQAFRGTNIATYDWQTTSISTLPQGLFRDSSLVSFDIPASVTQVDQFVFYECNSFNRLTMTDSVTSFNNANFFKTRIKSIDFSSNVTVLPGGLFYDGYGVDGWGHGFTSISGIGTGVTHIGPGTFQCPLLSTLDFPVLNEPTFLGGTYNPWYQMGSALEPDSSGIRARVHLPSGANYSFFEASLPSYVEFVYDL